MAVSTYEDVIRVLDVHTTRSNTKVATQCGRRTRSFAQLDRLSGHLANHLLNADTKAPTDVVVCVSCPDDAIVAALATLRLSACCIPVSPTCSVLGAVMDEVPPSCVVVDSKTESRFSGFEPARTIDIGSLLASLSASESEDDICVMTPAPPQSYSLPGPLFQILSEEGERCLLMADQCLSRYRWEWKAHPAAKNDVVAVVNDVDSARFWEDVVGVLAAGATLVIPTTAQKRSPTALLKFLSREAVTRLELSPHCLLSLLRRAWLEHRHAPLSQLTLVKCSQGLLTSPLVRLFRIVLPHARLVYVYEHAGLCCAYQCPPSDCEPQCHTILEGDLVVLGKPVGLCNVVVRDEFLRDCAQGETGSINLCGKADHVLVSTGDSGFVNAEGNLVLTAMTTPRLGGRKVDLSVLSKCISAIPGVDGTVVCWECLSQPITSLIAFYWSSTTGDTSGDLLRPLTAKLPRRWIPRIFPLGPLPAKQPEPSVLLRDYGDALMKLEACGELNKHRAAHVFVALARMLRKRVSELVLSQSYANQGASSVTCHSAASLIGRIGYQVSADDLLSKPLSQVVERAACSLVLQGPRQMRCPLVDATTSFESVASVLAKCFVAKNRLDLAVGNTEDQHMRALKHIWPLIVEQGTSRVILDESGHVAAVALGLDLCSEMTASDDLAEGYRAIMEMHQQLEGTLREAMRTGGHRMLLCFMVGTSMETSPADNAALVQVLVANMLHDARDRGFAGICSLNSHVVTDVITQRWLDFHVFDVTSPAEFEYRGRRPFANIVEGTTISVVYRFLRA
ncbi:uncharacterized protein LOC8037947 [Ixodes scapularis]|uniref:uncharacterized protein LOC8037947 n=1 Tax=Ixodes scapularis TaxID=6945 RepID=UPI001AD75DEA|nr:uncharacterized protein LOC8037947 [Ixodes scapularis]